VVTSLARMTWEEVRDADPTRCVALLPVGAVEAHGPHLPLVTDVVIAEAMAREGARRLQDAGIPALVLPSLPYSAAPFAAAFPGTVSVDPETLTRLLLDIAASLAGQGFRAMALANAHLDPAHLASLHAAVRGAAVRGAAGDGAAPRGLPVVFPDLTRKPWAMRLGEEFATGACHAGRYETSVVMAETPDDVREEIRAGLSPNPASLSDAIRTGKSTFAEADGPQAYFGWPADASAREGRETVATLGGILADAVREALERDA
jgi:creatinine amidohydrolase